MTFDRESAIDKNPLLLQHSRSAQGATGLQIGGVDFQGVSQSLGPYLFVVDDDFAPPFYDWGSGAVLHEAFDGTITVTLPAGTTAVGMDFMAFSTNTGQGEISNFTFALSTGDVFMTDSLEYPNRAFIGFHSLSQDITSITIKTTIDTDDHWFNIDNFTYGQVPAPVTLALFGVAGMGAMGRRRRNG